MKKTTLAGALILIAGVAAAEDLTGVDRFICSSAQAQICLETGECYAAIPWELDVPDFIVVDLDRKTVSTTEASDLNRSSEFSKVEKSNGIIYVQGIEDGRAFSFVIHESTGHMTAAIARDGLSVTVFGACTDVDI
jgi:hypothetical protein